MLSSRLGDIAATARAFATFSLVPYLGILFCPGAVLVGSVGILASYSKAAAKDGSRVVCYLSVLAGIVVLAIQILLWWILYQAPKWARGL